jgi:NhaA family Na+:H+ antiporter
METLTKKAMTPLQKLEHDMHPIVAFVVMPVFALSNAGVSFSGNFIEQATSAVAIGVASGLLIGKMIGIFGVSSLLIKLKWVPPLEGVTYKHLLGVGFIAAIGFTMSLFINELAFGPLGEAGSQNIAQAKIGIIIASVIGGFTGFFILKRIKKPVKVPDEI